MLLHVIAATVNVNQTMYADSLVNRFRVLQHVEDLPILSFRHLGDAQFAARLAGKNQAGVENLPATGGIEGSSIQDDGRTRFRGRRKIQDFRVEFVQKRIVIVEMLGHNLPLCSAGILPTVPRASCPRWWRRDTSTTAAGTAPLLIRSNDSADLPR